MGHDDDHGVARCLCKFVSWVVGAEGDGILRHVLGKLVLAAVDPADREGKRRQRQHDGPADVAGAKQQHRVGRLAEPFVERRPGEGGPPGFGRRLRCQSPYDPSTRIEPARGREGSRLLHLLEAPYRGEVGGVECLGERAHHAAAALAEIGTQRPVAELRRAAPGGKRRARPRHGFVLQAPAADSAEKAAVGLQHDAGAALARH